MEQNKIRSYLLYALGEIFLVVIGILIALQVNNWNEERKNRIYETTLLRNVHDALVIDQENLNSIISGLKKVQYSVQEIIRMKNEAVIERDSLYEYFDLIDGYGAAFLVNKSPFETIESGGLDRISNPELRKKLSTLYGFTLRSTESWINEVLRHELFKRNELREQIYRSRIIVTDGGSIINEPDIDNLEQVINHPKMDTYLYTAGWPLTTTISLMERAAVEMEELAVLINQEIEN